MGSRSRGYAFLVLVFFPLALATAVTMGIMSVPKPAVVITTSPTRIPTRAPTTSETTTGAPTSRAPTRAPGITYSQQGAKLVGSGALEQYVSQSRPALSYDGNTLLIGGFGLSAVWYFSRSGGVWNERQQFSYTDGSVFMGNNIAIVPNGSLAAIANTAGFLIWQRDEEDVWQHSTKFNPAGFTLTPDDLQITISGDGDIVAICSSNEQITGTVWVFRRNGLWWNQTQNIQPDDGIGFSSFGKSCSLSTDGNTFMIGGPDDNDVGAIWVYTKVGAGSFTKQVKLTGGYGFGYLSGDGLTMCRISASSSLLKVFTRSGEVWSQQGSDLSIGANPSTCKFSADGDIMAVGYAYANSVVGATYVFVRQAGVWTGTQTLVGTGIALTEAFQGLYLDISGDGTTIASGGYGDDDYNGATWVFAAD